MRNPPTRERRLLESGKADQDRPWFDITNKAGKSEHFFGNDRWDQITSFLGVEWQGLEYCQNTPNAKL